MQSILTNDLSKIFYGFIFVIFLIYLLYKVNATTQNNLVYFVTSALLADVFKNCIVIKISYDILYNRFFTCFISKKNKKLLWVL